jgi:transposase
MAMDGEGATRSAVPRFQRAERRQLEWREFSLDQFIPDEAPVRAVWAYVESLDLRRFYQQIQAVEGRPGRDPIDPQILLALWLYATVEGIGSARELDRLCARDLSYMWLCGGVSVNYHTLSDFRTQHVELLDELLTQSVAALLAAGLVELQRVAQDGMRVRAAAGSSSFRREATLEQHLADAQAQVAALQAEAEEDPGRGDRRRAAARRRAVEDRAARLQQALAEREQIAAKMEDRQKGSGVEARASTTDPQARKMKMGDGGFRPAYNVQFATTTDTQVVVGVDVTNAGTDGSQTTPMLAQIEQRYHQRPVEYLADGGFVNLEAIRQAESDGTTVYVPIMEQAQKRAKGIDPFAPLKGDSPEVARWRARMGTAAAQETYKQRAASAELTNAWCRNHGLQQFLVRGLEKVKAVALWHALARNFHSVVGLRREPHQPA